MQISAEISAKLGERNDILEIFVLWEIFAAEILDLFKHVKSKFFLTYKLKNLRTKSLISENKFLLLFLVFSLF